MKRSASEIKIALDKYREAMITTLRGWVNIGSVYDEKTAGPDAPFGLKVKEALRYIGNIAERDGFSVDYCDGYVTEITYDKGYKEYITILCHCDVVALGTGWTYPPLGGVVDNDIIYGRGVLDDKGPAVASYYALKALRDLAIPLKKNVRLLIGGNEESGSAGMHYYFNTLNKPQPTYGFTPDAEFPLIYGEKGILGYVYEGNYVDEAIEKIYAGESFNAVPATATIVFNKVMNVEKEFVAFLKKNDCLGTYKNDVDGKTIIETKGIAAHGSTPELGRNALTLALNFVAELNVSSLANHFAPRFAAYTGEGLKINGSGPKMGALTMNLGVGRYENGRYGFVLDIRYPIDLDVNDIIDRLNGGKMHAGRVVNDSKPLYLNPHSPMIETLYRVYREETGDEENKPTTIGGGTYARSARNTVAFGMEFLTRRGMGTGGMHSADESLSLADLYLGAQIYLRALIALNDL